MMAYSLALASVALVITTAILALRWPAKALTGLALTWLAIALLAMALLLVPTGELLLNLVLELFE